MKIGIRIDCSNAAFDGDARDLEVARILRELADGVIEGGADSLGNLPIRDVNGNVVGMAHTEA